MMTRRSFLQHTCACTLGILATSSFVRVFGDTVDEKLEPFKGTDIFDRILKKSLDEKWETLPIGQTMGHVAKDSKARLISVLRWS